MATTNMKTMREFFAFGFEQVKAVSVTTKENNFTADAKEFEKGWIQDCCDPYIVTDKVF